MAIKLCSSAKKKSLDSFRLYAVDQVEQEIRVLAALPGCRFIVEYLGHSRLAQESSICVAYSLVRGENLHSLVESRGAMPSSQVRHVGWSVMQAMAHLQRHGVVHGDIKPENVLFATDKAVRLSDFGCACKIEDCSPQRFKDIALVSPAFQSPEFASGNDEDSAALAEMDWFSVEMWSLGIVLFFVAAGTYPFDLSEGMLSLLERIANVEVRLELIEDESLRSLVASQLDRAAVRSNLQQSLDHPFVSGYTGEPPADTTDWKEARTPEISFVDGVNPNMYLKDQQRNRSDGQLRNKSGSKRNSQIDDDVDGATCDVSADGQPFTLGKKKQSCSIL